MFWQRCPWMSGKREKCKRRKVLVSADWLCLCLAPAQCFSSLLQSVGISHLRWKLRVFSGVFWPCILHWVHSWFARSSPCPMCVSTFECSNTPNKFSLGFSSFTGGRGRSVAYVSNPGGCSCLSLYIVSKLFVGFSHPEWVGSELGEVETLWESCR